MNHLFSVSIVPRYVSQATSWPGTTIGIGSVADDGTHDYFSIYNGGSSSAYVLYVGAHY